MLTDTKLRNLKPGESLYKVPDRDGMYVAVTPAGTVSFRYNYTINGRQETFTIGRYGAGGLTLAGVWSGLIAIATFAQARRLAGFSFGESRAQVFFDRHAAFIKRAGLGQPLGDGVGFCIDKAGGGRRYGQALLFEVFDRTW